MLCQLCRPVDFNRQKRGPTGKLQTCRTPAIRLAGSRHSGWFGGTLLLRHVLATIVEMATKASAKQVEPENDTTIIGAIPLQGTEIVRATAGLFTRADHTTEGTNSGRQPVHASRAASRTCYTDACGGSLRWNPVPVRYLFFKGRQNPE